jgi:hypothetical protein
MLSFHGDFWRGFIKVSVSHKATAAFVAITLTCGPIALLTWALISHAQGSAEHSKACDARNLPEGAADGFTGDSDFYGLGIRLGIYFQWLASLIANPLLKAERASMAGSYLTFSLALAVAILLLAFQHNCTFTAEIIIVLNIFWGGTLLVMVPFVQLLADIETTGLGLALLPLILSMLPVSTWFWLRLALYGEVDFAPTKGGTSFFLLARVTNSHIQAVSCFMAALCLALFIIPVFSSLCLCLVLSLSLMNQRPPGWGGPEPEEEKGMKERVIARWHRVRQRWRKKVEEKKKKHQHRLRGKWQVLHVGLMFCDRLTCHRCMVLAGIFIASWSILTVELTLAWNSVTGVYNVQSTGQIIALVVGLGILVKVLWLLRHGKVGSKTSTLQTTILTPYFRLRLRYSIGQGQNDWISTTQHHA